MYSVGMAVFTREAILVRVAAQRRFFSVKGMYTAEREEFYVRHAKLGEADLTYASLCEADLSDADLSGADLSDANLDRADLNRADLSGATLRDAYPIDANMSGADLRGARYDANTQWPEGFDPVATGAVLVDD